MTEEWGFESLFFPEHTHIPVSRDTPYPALVGGTGQRVIERVLAFGDEWMPTRTPDAEMIPRFQELARRAREAGRSIPITVAGMMRDPQRIERFERAGVHRSLFYLPATTSDDVIGIRSLPGRSRGLQPGRRLVSQSTT